MKKHESTLREAERILKGPRRKSYGNAEESFAKVAAVWSVVLAKKLKAPVEPRDVALCMVGLKLCREAASHHRDNCVDLNGYSELANRLAVRTPARKGKR